MFTLGYGILARLSPNIDIDSYRESVPYVVVDYNIDNGLILITIKDKSVDLGDNYSYIPYVDLPTDKDVALLNEIISSSEGDRSIRLYLFEKSNPVQLKIVTFNIATNVQNNIVTGSEAIAVTNCQRTHPQNNGWSVSPNAMLNSNYNQRNLSQCTLNAVTWIASRNPDLVGIQESVPTYLGNICSQISEKSGKEYQSIGSGSVQFIYNRLHLGEGVLLSEPNLHIIEENRLMIVVWFPKIKLLAINLHAPHNVDLGESITNTFETVSISIKPDRIIMTGDFNDGYRSPLTELNLIGKVLRQHGEPSKTCCLDTNFRFQGDYIFDSDYTKDGFYGVPNSVYALPMSDHLPVVFEES